MHKLGVVALALLVTGCATTEPTIVTKKEMILLDIDPRYLRDCHITPPPDKEAYLAATMDAKEDMLTRTILDQHQAALECSSDKRAIRSLIEKQRKEIDAFNQQSEKQP